MNDNPNNIKAEAWDDASSTLAAYAAKRHIPLRGTFELTARCNFNCKMCYVHMSQAEISACERMELTSRQWLALAEEAVANGTLNLLLTGGEPLIRDDFEEIYTEIAKMGFIISLNTNASLMNKKYFDLFSRYPPTSVDVTLYGADAETYFNISGNAGNFAKTIKGLEYLAEIPTSLEVRSTFIKDNKNQLDRLREIANRYTNKFAINYLVFKQIPGVMSSAEQCRLTPKECLDIDISNTRYYRDHGDDGEEAINRSFDSETPESDVPEKDYGFELPPKALSCMASKSMYWIRWDGKMLPCGTFVSPFTLPLEEGFKNAWDRLPDLLIHLRRPQKCIGCELFDGCPNCPAYFYVETGSYDKVSGYLCDLAKERRERYTAEASSDT